MGLLSIYGLGYIRLLMAHIQVDHWNEMPSAAVTAFHSGGTSHRHRRQFHQSGTHAGSGRPATAVAKQLPNEHSGVTVSINPSGIAYLNYFKPEHRSYNGSPISYAAKEPGKWEKLYTGIHSRYLTSGVRRFYQAGAVIVLLYMLWQLLHLRKIRNCSQQEGNFNGISLYNTSYNLPFSYGKYIFLPYDQPEDSREYVLLHEESHIRHKHFYKLCLMLFIARCSTGTTRSCGCYSVRTKSCKRWKPTEMW